jgi:hypothetical protein
MSTLYNKPDDDNDGKKDVLTDNPPQTATKDATPQLQTTGAVPGLDAAIDIVRKSNVNLPPTGSVETPQGKADTETKEKVVTEPPTTAKTDGDGTVTDTNPLYKLPYKEAKAQDNSLRWTDWVRGASAYRKANGQDPVTLEEIVNDLQGHDPLKTDEEREKEERRLRRAGRLNAVSTFLAHLANYVRTKNGHASMSLDGLGQKGQQRIDLLRQYHDKLDRQGYEDAVTSFVKDRAYEAEREAAEKAEAYKQLQLELQKENLAFSIAKNEQSQSNKDREYDLNVKKAEDDKDYHDKMAEAARISANKKGSGGGGSGGSKGSGVQESFTTASGDTYVRSRTLSPQEARNIVTRFGTDTQKKAIEKSTVNTDPDILLVASQVLTSGAVDEQYLTARDFKKIPKKSENSTPTPLGWGTPQDEDDEEDNDNVTDW